MIPRCRLIISALALSLVPMGTAVSLNRTDVRVQQLIARLKTGDFSACDKLAKIGKPAIKPLLGQLGDKDHTVQGYAAIALAKIGKPAIKPLLGHLGDKDHTVQGLVAIALGQMGTASIGPLTTALHDKDRGVRLGAAAALGFNVDPRSVALLISAFGDKARLVAMFASMGFGQKGSAAVSPLLVALEDKNPQVRECAAGAFGWMAIGKNKDKRAVLPLIERLKDKDVHVRAETAWGRLRSAAMPALSSHCWPRLRIAASTRRKALCGIRPGRQRPADAPELGICAQLLRL